MVNRRVSLHGLLAVLLALMVQLGVGASVPRPDPVALLNGTICHADDDAGGAPASPAPHTADCLVCPLCVAVHAPSVALVAASQVSPPAPRRPPSQPRAPPLFS
jgi:hypothetical protein